MTQPQSKPSSMRDRPTVRLKPPTYQPSKAELEETIHVRGDLTPEDIARAVTRPANIVYED